jgi:4-hydroxy-3-methylbut-2-enyl diphosphate reductase
MKQFNIPEFYRSPIISKVKAMRKADDPRKKDFSPTLLDLGKVRFMIARHFGFCYGVENAIEISYRAIQENPGKKIYLLSQMIHNPDVNADLVSHGITFIQDTDGSQLIAWDEITAQDVVIIPAFGTTIEIEKILTDKGVDVRSYNTTCPFVEKVWNRSEKLGTDDHTIIIHGKYDHEETRATFSHSARTAPSLIIKNMQEAEYLASFILNKVSTQDLIAYFEGRFTPGFDPDKHLVRIGVVNQTTMLASETQAIADFLRQTMIEKYGEASIRDHIADTRDTLCYATNDNQSATLGLMEQEADIAIVVGGYNSSNTTHLVELLEEKFPVFFVSSASNILENGSIEHFDIHSGKTILSQEILTRSEQALTIAITSGASCPDSIIDGVIQKIMDIFRIERSIEEALIGHN